MRTDYSEIFQDPAAVQKYVNVVYAPDTYASAINARQRSYLRRLVRRSFRTRRPVQHDFGCGTGRAVRLLHGLVREAHGYDTSAAMLDQARAAGIYAKWHQISEDGPVPTPVNTAGPSIVTVFRVLLNTPPEIHDRVLGFAADALPGPAAGLLVVENHGNSASLRHLSHRRHADDPWYAELSHRQIAKLLDRFDFEVVDRHGFALLPPRIYRIGWLRPVTRRIDDILCRTSLFSRFAVDVLYVARRRPQPGAGRLKVRRRG